MLDRIRELRALLFERKVSQADAEVRGAFEALVAAFQAHEDATTDAFSEIASIASLLVSSEATGSEAELLDEAVEGFLRDQADILSERANDEEVEGLDGHDTGRAREADAEPAVGGASDAAPSSPPPLPPVDAAAVAAPQLAAPAPALPREVVPTVVHRVERASELQAVSTRGLVGALLSDLVFRARLEGAVQGGATAPARAPEHPRQGLHQQGPRRNALREVHEQEEQARGEYMRQALPPTLPRGDAVRPADEALFDVLVDPIWADAPPLVDVADLRRVGPVRAVLNSSFRDTLEAMVWHRLDAHRRRGTAPPRRASRLQAAPGPEQGGRHQERQQERPQEQQQGHHQEQQQQQQRPFAFTAPAPSTRALEARVTELSGQLEEMQRMLRMSMEVTLDLQRSIRQEVAAALHGNERVDRGNRQGAAVLSRHPEGLVLSAPPTDPTCTVCFARSDCVLLRCGHVASCYTCAIRLREENCPCPVCRAPISDVARIFFA